MVMPVRTKADNAASRGVYPYPATVAVSELFFQHVNSTDAEPGLGVLLKLDLRAGGCGTRGQGGAELDDRLWSGRGQRADLGAHATGSVV